MLLTIERAWKSYVLAERKSVLFFPVDTVSKTLVAALQAVDEQIRSGQGLSAKQALAKLWKKDIPREHAIHFSQLARRANSVALGLRILHPYVRPEKGALIKPTQEEIVEYASSLVRIGANEEALVLLDKVKAQDHPKTLLPRAYIHMTQWDYAQTIPLLEKYLAATELTDYERLVGMVNLAAAFIHEREYAKAAQTLDAVATKAKEHKSFLLLGNSLELYAASLILQGEFKEAAAKISQAKELLKTTATLDEFFVRKWEAILAFRQKPEDENALSELHRIRAEAFERKHWEGARDCDRYEALFRKDKALLTHLYFGTPYEGYRKRLIDDFGAALTLPENYPWHPGGFTANTGKELDLLLPSCKADIGQLLFRLMHALASDFYRPVRVAALHFRCYPNEFYDPVTSPARIHVAVGRLRDYFEREKIPLAIIEEDGAYRLSSNEPCRLLVPRRLVLKDPGDTVLEKLRARWPNEFFTTREAAELLGTTSRTVLRILAEPIEAKQVEKTGKRLAAKYRFVA